MTSIIPEKCNHCGALCVQRIDFLAGLPAAKQALLMERAARLSYPREASLFREGDAVDAVYILHRGKVKLSTFDADGREQIVGIFTGGDLIWEGVLMEGSRFPYDGICLTEVDCCRLSRADFERTIEDPAIALRVIGLLSKKLHDANQRNLLLSKADPTARLAGFLVQRSQHISSDTVTLRLDDIAGSISLRAETVSRKLKELERMGAVKKAGQSSIRILDLEKLKEISEN